VKIRSRLSTSADGYATTPDGWPALLADLSFVPGERHGIREFLEGCEAALMGRTTFEPALRSERWPASSRSSGSETTRRASTSSSSSRAAAKSQAPGAATCRTAKAASTKAGRDPLLAERVAAGRFPDAAL